MEKQLNYNDSDIAVVGMACRLPDAKNYNEFWKNLVSAKESITFFSDEDLRKSGVDEEHLNNPNYVKAGVVFDEVEMFDAGFFGLSPKEAAIMDPQHRHFLECSWEALEDAGYTPEGLNGPIGVFGGCGMNSYFMFNILTNPKLIKSTGLFLLRHTGNDKDFLTTRVSYNFNLTGPSVNVQTACSTSLVAIHFAVQSLLNGECDMALAGGVTIELPQKRGYTYEEGEILSIDGHCRAFDHQSSGTIFGSGTGVVVLRRIQDAINDGDIIHGVIKATAINNDGSMKVGYLAPSVDGQSQAIVEALTIADINPETITYIETHGTGTAIGDPIEITALTEAFKKFTKKNKYCRIGSLKTNIGHLDTAAGVAGFIKTILALKHKQIPASLNFEKPNPQINFENSPFYVNDKLSDWTISNIPRRAGVSSLGVGGTNAHVIVEEAPALQSSGTSKPYQLLVWSARNQASIDGVTKKFIDFFEEEKEVNLADTSFTLQTGRKEFSARQILVAKNTSEAREILIQKDPKRLFRNIHEGQEPSVVFMFPGGGAQYPNMGLELYIHQNVYREELDKCLSILKSKFNLDLQPLFFPEADKVEEAAAQLQKPLNSILSIFITEFALAKMWISWGIKPSSMTGHSMGEYAAACISDVMSLEDALALVELRGRIFEKMPEGGMLSVPLPEAEVLTYTNENLSVAVVNGESTTVLSGTVDSISEAEIKLKADGVDANRIKISVAAHSKMLDPYLEEFRAGWAKVKLSEPKIPFVSNLSGTWIKKSEATSPDYWVNHLRKTVRFADGLSEILKESNSVFLEVGPGNTLSSLVRSHPSKTNSHSVIASLRHPQEIVSDYEYILRSVGRLWLAGLNIQWSLVRGNEKRKRINLPTYAFDHQPYWIEPGKSSGRMIEDSDPLKKITNLSDWFSKPVWKKSEFAAFNESEFKNTKKSWLLLISENDLSVKLNSRLSELNQHVITVKHGESFIKHNEVSYSLNAGSHDDFILLIENLSKTNMLPDFVLHAWGTTESNDKITKQINHEIDFNFYSLLFLAQALGNEDLQKKIKIISVTDSVHKTGTEKINSYIRSVNLGPVKVIPKEFPDIECSAIDIENNTPVETTIERILSEFNREFKDSTIAYRDGNRLVQTFEKLNINSIEKQKPLFKDGGVYILTGGLGGISLTLAKDIAKKYHARLVLVSRQQLPPSEEWGKIIVSEKQNLRLRDTIHKLIEIQNFGAEIQYVSADITDTVQLEKLFESVKNNFGKINGVIHSAGTIDDGVILFKKKEDAHKVLAPKVHGTLLLAELAEKYNPEFIIMFSSASAILGPTGQVDYTSANCFLDALAQAKKDSEGTRFISINWGQWQEVGMAARIAQSLGIIEEPVSGKKSEHPLLGINSINNPDELEFTNLLQPENFWILNEHQTKQGDYIIPGTGYLELALASVKNGKADSVDQIKDTFFLSPVLLKQDETKELKIKLNKVDDEYEFTVLSKPVSAGSGWEENVRGFISTVKRANSEKIKLEKIISNCGKVIPIQDKKINHPHMNFGARWKNLVELRYGTNEAIAKIQIPTEFKSEISDFRMHPALMDTATGCAQSLAGFDPDKDFYLPFSYSKVVVYNDLPQSFYSHIKYLPSENNNLNSLVFDITIADESGSVLIEVKDFVMKKINRDDKLSESKQKSGHTERIEGVHNPVNPKAMSNNILQLGQREGILPGEGAEVFSMIADNPSLPQYIVVSQNLHALFDNMIRSDRNKTTTADSATTGESSRPNLSTEYIPPSTDVEKTIAEVWQEVLGVDMIGINDDFLELGGHSLLLTRIVMKVRKKFSIDLSLGNLFEVPTIAAFAREVNKASESKSDKPVTVISSVSRQAYRVK
ncbi:MAG: SDR family oxidoreductase [Ignavibacteriales bacterium]|nr:MAG: SDR family oxidoreductase [Ignavibacteriales bacterium]